MPTAHNSLYRFFCLMVIVPMLFGAMACTKDNANGATPDSSESLGSSLNIVSLNGAITEVLYDLGYGDQIVGIDITSTYPADPLKGKAQLGHTSKLNAEAILALAPDYIFCLESEADKPVLQQLANTGVKLVPITVSTHLNNSAEMAAQLHAHLGGDDKPVRALQKKIQSDSLSLAQFLTNQTTAPKVLFIYARGTGRLFVGGADTPVAAMIEKAGGVNAVASMSGYKELTTESLLAADPDVLLLFSSGLASLDGKAGLTQIAGMEQVKAYQNDRIIAMDGHYLSSFGPRCGAAALELAQNIHQTTSN